MPPDPASSAKMRRLRIGKYQVLSHIATGGMGAVYKAQDVETGRFVALKVLPPELVNNPKVLERFRREASVGTRLKHENIVEHLECGEFSGIHFLALEFVEGADLQEYITRKEQLEVKESRMLVAQATRALAHLQQHGIVHRDIKPSNFIVTQKDGQPLLKLIDLGLARESSGEEFRVTTAGTTLGTVDYMAPEQARDSGRADVRSDIYSLGCTWYHMLAGKPPFPEGGLTERLYQHAEHEPTDIRQLNRKVPATVAEIIKQMMAKDPAKRYQTPALLLRDLEPSQKAEEPFQRDVLAALAFAEDEAPRSEVKKRRTTVKPEPEARPKARSSEEPREFSVTKTRANPRAPKTPLLVPLLIGAAVVLALLLLVFAMLARR